ncbi:MAG: glycosyltransferase [Pirellula sp.]|jgi:hypothetical protein|nr:glycosyltransferase [Pirellula sp.]
MVTVVCTRWLDAFPVSYVRLLKNAVAANLQQEHRFVCVTDNPEGLDSDIEGIRMPDMGLPLHHQKLGCWPKLSIFAPGVLPPDEPALYLDLDVLVRSSLEPFFEQIRSKPGLHVLREWNPTLWNMLPHQLRPDRGVQGSILGFIPRDHAYIYEQFMADKSIPLRYPLDQDFLTEHITNRTYWPISWTASFKWHCTKYYPLNLLFPKIREPKRAKIVVFHGKPRPVDVVPLGNYRWGAKRKFGFGPVSWVRDYWLRYDPSWTEPSQTEASLPASHAVAAAA